MREVARWQSWPKEGESETENHESAELQSDQIKEMSKTSKAAKRQSAIKSLDSWLSHGSWSGFAAGAPCGYGSRKVLGSSKNTRPMASLCDYFNKPTMQPQASTCKHMQAPWLQSCEISTAITFLIVSNTFLFSGIAMPLLACCTWQRLAPWPSPVMQQFFWNLWNFHRSVPMDLGYGVVGEGALYISLDRNVACWLPLLSMFGECVFDPLRKT